MEWSSVRIPAELKQQIQDLIKRIPFWTSPDEFVRDAVREKINVVENRKEADSS